MSKICFYADKFSETHFLNRRTRKSGGIAWSSFQKRPY